MNGRCVWLLLIFSFIFFSCGYEFTATKKMSDGIESIFVPVVKNSTEEANLESMFTNKLIGELLMYLPSGVGSMSNSDAILSGEIVSLYTENVPFNGVNSLNASRRLIGTVTLILHDTYGNVLWNSDYIRDIQDYVTIADDGQATEANRKLAIAKLFAKLSSSSLRMLLERF